MTHALMGTSCPDCGQEFTGCEPSFEVIDGEPSLVLRADGDHCLVVTLGWENAETLSWQMMKMFREHARA